MRITLLLIFTLTALSVSSQSLQVFAEPKDQGAILFARNIELFPMSIKLELDLTNMSFSENEKREYVIPASSEKFKIGELKAERNKIYKYQYRYKSFIGDFSKKTDTTYNYDLPYQTGTSSKLYQGYDGAFSHRNEYSLDFSMPIGTKILASRDGIVVRVVQENTESCILEECKKYNNYVTIMHEDGSFASYVHIKYNGSVVKIGDDIKKGDLIAYSGDVGYASGPHLHFVCYQANLEGNKTIATRFRIGKGDIAAFLAEGNFYSREY